MSGWIDTHAHLVSDELYDRFDEIKEKAISNGIEKICIICGTLVEVERAFLKAENDPYFDFAIGVHPTSALDVSEKEMNKMMQFVESPQVKFIGEIGLDYYWDQSYIPQQQALFKKQIMLANQHNLPIAIHIRSAVDDVYNIIKENPVNKTGIAHCFSESVEDAQKFLELGYYLGVGGIVTFKNGQNIKDIVNMTPLDRILTETDSPYLAPVPKRGKRNESAFVSYVGEEIARLKEIDEKTLKSIIINNYNTLTK